MSNLINRKYMEGREKVLITGADGFIGSHLTETFLTKGYRVRALSYYNSFNYWGWLEDIPKNKNLEIVSGDIRDPFFCNRITEDIDIVINLAALIAIPYSYIAPGSYVDTNIKGSLNICQAALSNNVKHLVHTSTSEVYGSARVVPITELHPKQPQSPYSASKIGADAIALSYFYSFDLPVTVARPFNTYGPRQSARAIIPSIIIQIASGAEIIEVGDISTFRDFNYVKDTCNGILSLTECEESIGKEVNISSNTEISIKDTLEIIKEIMKSKVTFKVNENRLRPTKSEVTRLWGDNSLLKELTGYKPQFSFIEGLRKTCNWFSDAENIKKYKKNIVNL